MLHGNQLALQWQILQLLDRPEGLAVEDTARDLACVVRTNLAALRALEAAVSPDARGCDHVGTTLSLPTLARRKPAEIQQILGRAASDVWQTKRDGSRSPSNSRDRRGYANRRHNRFVSRQATTTRFGWSISSPRSH